MIALCLVAPSVSIQPDQDPLVVAPNETVQLACIPSGNPKPTVSWERVVSFHTIPRLILRLILRLIHHPLSPVGRLLLTHRSE